MTIEQENITRTEEYLEERFHILQMEASTPADLAYFHGCEAILHTLGFEIIKEGNSFKLMR